MEEEEGDDESALCSLMKGTALRELGQLDAASSCLQPVRYLPYSRGYWLSLFVVLMNFGECSVRKSSKIIFVKNNWLSHFRFLSSPLQWSWDSSWIQIILRWGLQGADMLCGEGTLCNSNGCIWACFAAHYATHRSGYKRINRHKQLWTSFGGMEALSGFWCQRCTVAGVSN